MESYESYIDHLKEIQDNKLKSDKSSQFKKLGGMLSNLTKGSASNPELTDSFSDLGANPSIKSIDNIVVLLKSYLSEIEEDNVTEATYNELSGAIKVLLDLGKEVMFNKTRDDIYDIAAKTVKLKSKLGS